MTLSRHALFAIFAGLVACDAHVHVRALIWCVKMATARPMTWLPRSSLLVSTSSGSSSSKSKTRIKPPKVSISWSLADRSVQTRVLVCMCMNKHVHVYSVALTYSCVHAPAKIMYQHDHVRVLMCQSQFSSSIVFLCGY